MTREREYFFGEDRMRPGGPAGPGGPGGPPQQQGGPFVPGRGPPAPGGPPGGVPGAGGFVHKSQIVKALKETMQTGHRTGLPPKLLEYFQPQPPLQPGTELKVKKLPVPVVGLAPYVHMFAGPQDPEEVKPDTRARLFKNPELKLQCRLNTETRTEKQLRLAEWKREEAVRNAAEAAKGWDPHKDPKIDGDPFRTIFVGRLSYEVTDKKLRREFEDFGPIKRVRMLTDKAGKSRGYAFVEYEDKKDMKEAYKAADGRKIEGRRILVDVERGRTVESWRPRRLGGGLGGEGRLPKAPKKAPRGSLPMMPPPIMSGGPGDDRRRERSPARPADRDRERADRDRADRERADRERRDRERVDRERSDRERTDKEGADRAGADRERSDRDRGGGDRERGGDRDRKRDRDASPRRDRDRAPEEAKRRRDVEEGELVMVLAGKTVNALAATDWLQHTTIRLDMPVPHRAAPGLQDAA
eukprot:CAMPEP_0119106118 /NCGR_PEP_ID=MMETSP1180-20130426/3903_1 /TAXON_ID=3052 ORGANISM="Chlamydomonas cf sp, Strain CCMP681" /NCGR_SAMPLE_ID=MMETSP1180 /ASSEMBLY_ACC=CAM_ASM_000741 /LENGTH=469 /DNA_ID=CAMNT_0007091367 /DNA_START=16 /DNA_END=1426 /DNA_ORIENTATION=-